MNVQVKRNFEMLGKDNRKFSLVLFCLLLVNPVMAALADGFDREALLRNKISRINVVMENKKLHAFYQNVGSGDTGEGFFAPSLADKIRDNKEMDRQVAPILRKISDYDYVGSTIQSLREKLSGKAFSSNLKIKLLSSYPKLKLGEPVLAIEYMFDKDFGALNIQAMLEFKARSSEDSYEKIFLSRFKAWPETTKPDATDNIKYWQNNPEFLKSQLSRGIAEISKLIYDDFATQVPKRKKWQTVNLQSAYTSYKQAEIISEKQGRVFIVKRKNETELIHAMVDAGLLGKRREKKKSKFFDGFTSASSDDDE